MRDHNRAGTIVGNKWRLERRLGSGRTATIYAATNIRNGYPAAVKVFEETLGGSLREAYIANSVYRGAVRVLGDGITDDGSAYLVMERLRGETLDVRRRREGRLPTREAVTLASAVLAILAEAHACGIAHRDVTLANVFVTTEGQVRLLGFGGPRVTPTPDSQTLVSLGVYTPAAEEAVTLPFLSGPAVDLQGVGAMLAELCQHPQLPAAIARILDRANAAHFPDAESMITALEEAARGLGSTASALIDDEAAPVTLRIAPPASPSPSPPPPPTAAAERASAPCWPRHPSSSFSPIMPFIATPPRGSRSNAPTVRVRRPAPFLTSRIARNFLVPAIVAFVASVLVIMSVSIAPETLRGATRSVVVR